MKRILLINKYLPEGNADLITGTITVLIGIFFIVYAIPYQISLGFGSEVNVSPRTLPYGISIVMILCGFIVLGNGYKKSKGNKNSTEQKSMASYSMIALIITLIGFFFSGTIKVIGYPLSNIICMSAIYFLYGGKKIVVCLLLSVIFTVISWLFFVSFLNLSIPLGFGL